MHCTRKITDDITWVGGNDRRLAMFEGVYSVPRGVSYNSYLLCDDKTVLFDTVDKSVSRVFFENIAYCLGDRGLDYLIIQHMEPDHSGTLAELLLRYPDVTVVCSEKIRTMINQFFALSDDVKFLIISEGDTLKTANHCFNFVAAPMVHWPEVTLTYDSEAKILFSADAFGTFGALNGALFNDEVDFWRDYLDDARRYYCNIVGKYGAQVQALLKKASALEIKLICPLHGFVWRSDIAQIIEKYQLWSSYTPEEKGVVIAYASVYGNTENAAEILACRLREKGVNALMFDVSVTSADNILASVFKFSHVVFASCTYNAGIFVGMENLLNDLKAHNMQNRTVAFMQNGTWAAASAKQMRELLSSCKNLSFIETSVTLKSSLKPGQLNEIEALADNLAESVLG